MSFSNPAKAKAALRYWLQGGQYFTALKALDFAGKYHVGMRRDGVTPEFHHQISISLFIRTLKDLIHVERCIAAACLHDVVEDYNISKVEITNLCGPEIANSVGLLSKIVGGIRKDEETYYREMGTDAVASIVKGCDRIHNFQTMIGVFTPEKQKQYIAECKDHILPMLKEARRRFPEQEPAYENIKHVLYSQIALLEHALSASSIS